MALALEHKVNLNKPKEPYLRGQFIQSIVRNLSQHRREVHGSSDVVPARQNGDAAAPPRSRSSSKDSATRVSMTLRSVSDDSSSEGPAESCSTHALMEAAQALLDQHQSFTEVQLIDYISECFPEVPPWER